MKWDPDKAAVQLGKWTGISAELCFTRRHVLTALLKANGWPVRLTDGDMAVVCELSVLTNDGRAFFLGRTFYEAFLAARKALRPKPKYKKLKDRRPARKDNA